MLLQVFLISSMLTAHAGSFAADNRSTSLTKIINAPELSGASLSLDGGILQDGRQRHAEARAQRNERFIARQDSLVASHDFQFLPISVQDIPTGGTQMISNFYYYVGVLKDRVEVHIPTLIGYVEAMDIVNFDTGNVKNYSVVKMPFGWNVAFTAIAPGGESYVFSINVYTATSQAIMVMLFDGGYVRYVGSIVKNEPIQVGPL